MFFRACYPIHLQEETTVPNQSIIDHTILQQNLPSNSPPLPPPPSVPNHSINDHTISQQNHRSNSPPFPLVSNQSMTNHTLLQQNVPSSPPLFVSDESIAGDIPVSAQTPISIPSSPVSESDRSATSHEPIIEQNLPPNLNSSSPLSNLSMTGHNLTEGENLTSNQGSLSYSVASDRLMTSQRLDEDIPETASQVKGSSKRDLNRSQSRSQESTSRQPVLLRHTRSTRSTTSLSVSSVPIRRSKRVHRGS